MLYEFRFLLSLAITLIIEILMLLIFTKFFVKQRNINYSRVIFVGGIASLLTLPYLWFILPIFISNSIYYILIGELGIILIEALIYNQLLNFNIKTSILSSLTANLISFLFGPVFWFYLFKIV